MRARHVLALLAALAAGGCVTPPPLEAPQPALPATFRHAAPDATRIDPAAWWLQLRDPVLARHIDLALQRNFDLRTAAAVLTEYEALLRATRGGAAPQVSLAAGEQRARTLGIVGGTWQAAASASWEIDFWGRLRSTTDAARADLLGQRQGRRALELLVIGSVAQAYIGLLELDEQMAIARRTLAGRERSLQLARAQVRAGVAPRVIERQAESEYHGIALQVQQVEQAVALREHELSLLSGVHAGAVERGATLSTLVQPAVPEALPADLLARRPDVLQAGEAMAAADARLSATAAATWPTISLTGSIGSTATSLDTLFRGPASTWAFGPTLNLPLFDGGQLAAQVDASAARSEQARIAWLRVVHQAVREVEDALVSVRSTAGQVASQAAQVAALRDYERLARRRYEGGVTSYLELLDAQRSLLAGELGLAQARSASLQASVALYKALGGEWIAAPAALSPSPTPAR